MKIGKICSILAVVLLLYVVMGIAEAAPPDYGAVGASMISDDEMTLSRMLTFALQDEYLARGEYQVIIGKFGDRRPFSNIIKAEEQHIAWLLPMFEKYGVPVPADRGIEFAQMPGSPAEALQMGVNAENGNIEMYERFLRKELPADVKAIFEHLLGASKNHLAAFQGKRGGGKSGF